MKALSRFCTLALTLSLLSLFLNCQDGSVPAHSSVTDPIPQDALNTTVVILNWSRLENVKEIVSQICSTLLHDTVRNIVIWNNNPNPLSFAQDFTTTSCPPSRLEIINSLENLYFQARYMACARASTPYCLIQDDDFLVRPEIIKSLHRRIHEAPTLSSIHIQPADELLTSELRTIRVDDTFHTTFAWLGYGTIIRRRKAAEFLKLLDMLEVTEEERKMADNYFTILSNEVPERWFDPGIPLGGGQPFTVGQEGEDRNNRHIVRAAELLQSISEMDEVPRSKLPYLSPQKQHPDAMVSESASHRSISRAPCHKNSCIFETSIALIPENVLRESVAAGDKPNMILKLEKQRSEALGLNRTDMYVRHPPSNAVDGDIGTAFRSPENAKEGDWIGVNLLATRHYASFNLVILVDKATHSTFEQAIFEISEDGSTWANHFAKVECFDHELKTGNGPGLSDSGLRRCVFGVENVHMRSVRLRILGSTNENWGIYEVSIE